MVGFAFKRFVMFSKRLLLCGRAKMVMKIFSDVYGYVGYGCVDTVIRRSRLIDNCRLIKLVASIC